MRKIQNLKAALLQVFLGIFFSMPLLAQSNNSISGFIFGSNRTPVPDTFVELQDDLNRTISRVKTDGSGRYFFRGIRQGRYVVRVFPVNTIYLEQTGEVEIVNIARQSGSSVTYSASENVQKDFYLRDKRAAEARSSSFAVVFAQDVPKTARDLYQMAVRDFDNKAKQNEADANLRKAIQIFPDYYEALEKLAQRLIRTGNFIEAADTAKRAVEVNRKGFEGWYSLGYALNQQKKYSDSLDAVETALDISPLSVNSLFLLGVNLRHLGRYNQAVESLVKAKKASNLPIAEIHWQLALLYTNNLKNYSAAIKELEHFLKISPKYEEADKVRELIKKLKAKEKA